MRRAAALILLCALLGGCAGLAVHDEPASRTAEETLTLLRAAAAAGDLEEVRRAGTGFLERRPDDPDAAEVRLLVARADIELGFFAEAAELLAPLLGETGDAGGQALLLLSRVSAANGRFEEAAIQLMRSLELPISKGERGRAAETLAETLAILDDDALERAAAAARAGAAREAVSRERLSRAYAAGDSSAVRRLGEDIARVEPATAAPVLRIGLLCPLSGRYAPLGEAFLQGAAVAAQELRRRGLDGIELPVADSRGDPLAAQQAMRRLVEEEHVTAVVGGVLSSPTIAAAQFAQNAGTVLFSPVATAHGIGEIGEWIFQAGDVTLEEPAVARLAVVDLDLHRIAFLGARSERSRRTASLFRAEVERAGGELVAAVFYDEGSSDFRDVIESVRRAAPEALFVVSDTEDLFLLLPQFSFYEFGVQLLGTSAWNSRRLLRMAGKDMEGAIFPVQTTGVEDEARFRAAAELLDRSDIETNPFAVGGYAGLLTTVEAAVAAGRGGVALRTELEQLLEHRLHPWLELATGRGLQFRTVRNERIVEFER